VEAPATDHRRATAERNVQAILDAAEDLLDRRGQPSVSAVAIEAGVSRVTVYAHFPTSEALLEAVVQRAVGRSTVALDEARPDSGPAPEALDRVLAAGWQELDRYGAVAVAAATELSPDALTRTHESAHERVRELVERGQADGTFRTDLPAGWLVASCFALVHACAGEVRAGRIGPDRGLDVLTTTVRSLVAHG
jgi:TetR/AcrR family transcriptional regulator, mexCD-oprJ operon repressor